MKSSKKTSNKTKKATSTKTKAKSTPKRSKASAISFKSAATVRNRTEFINSLSPAKKEIVQNFFTYNLEQTQKRYPSKRSLVTKVYNEVVNAGIYFKTLKTSSKKKAVSTNRK